MGSGGDSFHNSRLIGVCLLLLVVVPNRRFNAAIDGAVVEEVFAHELRQQRRVALGIVAEKTPHIAAGVLGANVLEGGRSAGVAVCVEGHITNQAFEERIVSVSRESVNRHNRAGTNDIHLQF